MILATEVGLLYHQYFGYNCHWLPVQIFLIYPITCDLRCCGCFSLLLGFHSQGIDNKNWFSFLKTPTSRNCDLRCCGCFCLIQEQFILLDIQDLVFIYKSADIRNWFPFSRSRTSRSAKLGLYNNIWLTWVRGSILPVQNPHPSYRVASTACMSKQCFSCVCQLFYQAQTI